MVTKIMMVKEKIRSDLGGAFDLKHFDRICSILLAKSSHVDVKTMSIFMSLGANIRQMNLQHLISEMRMNFQNGNDAHGERRFKRFLPVVNKSF